MSGKRLERVGDRAGEDRVVLEPLAVALVERPLLGLPQRDLVDPLPERRQPEDRLQAIRLADLADRTGRPRGGSPSGSTVRAAARAAGWARRVRPRPGSRSSRAREVADGSRSAPASVATASTPSSSRARTVASGLDAQAFERVGQPGHRPGRRLGQGEEAQRQPRPVREPAEHRFDRAGILEVLGDLPGQHVGRPRARARRSPSASGDRAEPRQSRSRASAPR